ncbi:hypothetical protein CR66_03400 [Campylobacter mucosalis]|uniref:hypothetical protein n=1 Tax=Campylobacter mucosalis TaxID=202 RepID=UPI0004D8439F|nr:hypothetical protein [Campylobacter mucosalis]KEA46251.1 hypothetical protein CR66_03400 [Campylobacter mucosalis]QKF62712.1 hypothetical protein CMCT_0557 [Campylobacter mucosalis]
MGIKSYEFSYETQSKEHLGTKVGADFNAGAKVKDVGGELNASANLNKNKTQTQHTHQIQKHENMNETPVSSDELAQFIKDEGINLNALPSFFGERVKRYLENSQISGNIQNCEKLSYSLEENAEFLASLSAKVKLLPSFISANLNMNFNQKRTYEFAKSITYDIKF